MTDESESYPDDLWQLVLSRRELLALLPDVDQDTQANLRQLVEDLELVALAAAWGIPEAVVGHREKVPNLYQTDTGKGARSAIKPPSKSTSAKLPRRNLLS